VRFSDPSLQISRIINHLTDATAEEIIRKSQSGVIVLNAETRLTGSWADFATISLGVVTLPAGPITIELESKSDNSAFMDIRGIKLLPSAR
jgi:hypothetical protein